MALTILEKPIGVILGTCVEANINEDYNGFATVNKAAHGLTDNNWVYISSNVENYNGFWQIDVINTGEFALRQSSGVYVSYVVDANITYCPQVSTHGWSCVHLPITYKILNNRYPVNTVDSTRTITTITNNGGLTQFGISGSLGTFEDLSFIKISNAPDSTLNGVYQILEKLSTTSIVLNLNFSSVTAASIIGASIQLYYGNYTVVVNVYAGINSSHEWASEKPYELAATLELTPDSDNLVFFSINELLKDYVKLENNLLLPSLPNNIDAWTNFYIETSEAYDSSNGYTVITNQSGFTSDQSTFEGTAVNAMLEFKNDHSGYLSEYLMTNSAAKFLTLFAVPVLFSCGEDTPDCYSDISFIVAVEHQKIIVKKEYYINGILQSTISETTDPSTGVIRQELDSDCSYDRVDVTVMNTPPDLTPFTRWTNSDNPSFSNESQWSNGVNTISIAVPVSDYYLFPFIYKAGVTYTITYNMTTVETGDMLVDFAFFLAPTASTPDGSFDGVSVISLSSSGVSSGSVMITPSVSAVGYLGIFQIDAGSVSGSLQVTINSISISFTDTAISETKTFDVDCGCSDQEIRLTWLNNLGGFDYWVFNSQTGHGIDVSSAGETSKVILQQWPKSYGKNADTIRKQTFRTSNKKEFISMEYFGKDREDMEDKANALAYIKSSPLVQIINSRQDRRTVIVDTDSFLKFTDGDKKATISFNIAYTDDIPSQRL